jgi:N6-adenosine-specific RNA methylase IME4
MEELGFQYILSAVLIKEGKIGLGQYLRHRHEHLLLGRMGGTMLPPPGRRPSSIIRAPRRGHSVKPGEAFNMIEAISPGPRLEMFARRERAGWDCWGDEIGDDF